MTRCAIIPIARGAVLGFTLALPATLATAAPDKQAVIETYADIAEAMYQDSLMLARDLDAAIERLIAEPGEATLTAAREAWLAARVPYQQTEVYRFGNAIVDDWEGRVNAWPLDEGLIDYVDTGYGTDSEDNPLYTANVIASTTLDYGAEPIDASEIDRTLLDDTLHEIGGIEANIAIGYHAIEFLLWGQDLNGTGPGNGGRPWTDYASGEQCSNGNCERRARYLDVATDLLIDDLAWMAEQWEADGEARRTLTEGDPDAGIATMLTGLGSLSYGELAGERMQLGLMLNDPEEEHDCFSDNTHNSHYYNVVGMQAVYLGRYQRIDGDEVSGPSLSELVAAANPELDEEMRARLDATHAAMNALKQRAESVEAYDQMLAADNPEGNAVIQAAIDALTTQTRSIERIVAALDLQPIQIEGSDSLDDPAAVFGS